MCGIVGFVTGNKSFKNGEFRSKAFTQLLITDALRGMDSTGVFTVDNSNSIEYYKKALPPWDFMQMKKATILSSVIPLSGICIGHNRSATKGKVTDVNAHPFDFSDVIGVHNGTLHNDWELSKDLQNSKFYTVDSERMYAAINEYGYKEIIPKINGAFSLVWYDKEDKVLRAIRNEERPLSFCTIDDEETVFIASELDHLKWVVGRNGYKAKFYNLDVETLIEFPRKDPRKFVTSKMELLKKTKTYGYVGGYSHGYSSPLKISLCSDIGVKFNEKISFKPTEVHRIENSDLVKVLGEIPSIKTKDGRPVLACGYGLKESDIEKSLLGMKDAMIEGMAGGVRDTGKEVILILGDCKIKTDRTLTLPSPEKWNNKSVKHSGEEYTIGFESLDLSKKQFKRWKDLTKDGCFVCTSPILPLNLGSWLDGKPLCIECVNELGEPCQEFTMEDVELAEQFPPIS